MWPILPIPINPVHDLQNILPVIRARAPGFQCVMRGREKHALTLKPPEVAQVVIDHHIGGQNALVAAENDVQRRDSGKMFPKPGEFGRAGRRIFHGGRRDEDFAGLAQGRNGILCAGHDGE